VLEHASYKKLVVRDVNNYLAVKDNGDVKYKGAYEIDKEIHKSQSMRIVPYAVSKFLVEGIPIEETVNKCVDMKMFIMGKRAKTGSLKYKQVSGSQVLTTALPKNVRYYISTQGGSIVKSIMSEKKKVLVDSNQTGLFDVNESESFMKEKIINLHVGRRMTLFNVWQDKPFYMYGIDKAFYINEAKKLI